MNVIRATLVASLVLLAVAGCARDSASQVLQHDEIEAMVARFQVAAEAMDADAMAPFLAADVTFDVTVDSQGERLEMRMDRAEYLQSIRDARQVTSSYEYRPGARQISIDADGRTAQVRQISEEVMVVMGQRVSGRSDGVYRVRASDQGPVIYAVTGTTRMSF